MILSWFSDYGIGYLLTLLVLVWTIVSFFLLQKSTNKNSKELLKMKTKEDLNLQKQKEYFTESFKIVKEITSMINGIVNELEHGFARLNGEHKLDDIDLDKYVALEFTKKFISPVIISTEKVISSIVINEHLLPMGLKGLSPKLVSTIIQAQAYMLQCTNKLNNLVESDHIEIRNKIQALRGIKQEYIDILWHDKEVKSISEENKDSK
jgi:hypothetical protein